MKLDILNISILLGTALVGGLLAFPFAKISIVKFKTILTFSGSYLFSLTIIHLLPEVFSMANDEVSTTQIGTFLLIGFFIQKLLEYFSEGIEHGHMHTHSHSFSAMSTVIALSIHSFLEGTVLTHHHHVENHHHEGSMLLGIVFHKIPAAFVLTTILLSQLNNKKKVLIYLLLFVIASPLGLLVSNYLNAQHLLSGSMFIYLFAMVAGNFLHISTTIFYESNPEHHFNLSKVFAILLGVGGAILTQYL
jgi:zinc and cadmium transporter